MPRRKQYVKRNTFEARTKSGRADLKPAQKSAVQSYKTQSNLDIDREGNFKAVKRRHASIGSQRTNSEERTQLAAVTNKYLQLMQPNYIDEL